MELFSEGIGGRGRGWNQEEGFFFFLFEAVAAAGDGCALAHGAVGEAPPPPQAPRHHIIPLAQVAENQG